LVWRSPRNRTFRRSNKSLLSIGNTAGEASTHSVASPKSRNMYRLDILLGNKIEHLEDFSHRTTTRLPRVRAPTTPTTPYAPPSGCRQESQRYHLGSRASGHGAYLGRVESAAPARQADSTDLVAVSRSSDLTALWRSDQSGQCESRSEPPRGRASSGSKGKKRSLTKDLGELYCRARTINCSAPAGSA
jgi:hypothetical protein